MLCDGLTGFPDAINATFPKTIVQLCIVHRNSLKLVSYKHYKEVTSDLKLIYTAKNEESAMQALLDFEGKWSFRYP
ncbi:transposase, partial [Candidatus Cyrtobacter comes]|uniref:transposase n=1 Tax=Candidatus Cyrtobacter comes TaxID=675776 RepID=UPI0039778267